ncbi:tetratricopeptide repeat protein, partial [Candidatus Thioglobus sp.]|nr:tetratricopeptide repeat protein [Candidatus Thioglobus sp.]
MSPTQEQINSVLELFTNSKLQEALDALDLLSKDYPDDALLFNIRGACFAGLGQKDAAVESYKQAVLLKPDYAKAHYNLGGALQEISQLDDAVKSYESAIALEPDNAEAHNNLGNVLRELEQLDAAINSYEKAIVINPNYVEAHYSLGLTFQDLGQLENTVNSYKKVVAIKPDFAGMHNNLGNVYRELGELDAALKSYKKAIAIQPDFFEVFYNQGIIFQELDQLGSAVKSYKDAITINPDYCEALNNLGVILNNLGEIDEAINCYKSAIAINPDYSEAHNNLGIVLKELDKLDAAADCHEKAIAIKSDFIEAHNNLGIVYLDLNQLSQAAKSFEQAIILKPDYAEAHNNLGIVFKELDKLDGAVDCYEKAIAIKPDYAEAHNNLGITLMDLGRLEASAKCYAKALSINPDYAYALNNLGVVFNRLGELDEANNCFELAININLSYAEAYSNRGNLMTDFGRNEEALKDYQKAYKLQPDTHYMLGNILNTKMNICLWDDLSEQVDGLIQKINNGDKVIGPFAALTITDDPALQKKAAEIYVNDKFPISDSLPKIGRYSKHKKIRIGYFSADFREHPVSTLTAELYEIHDRSQFEVYAFSYGPDTKDKMNLRIKAGVDHFYDVCMMPHKDLVLLSRSLEIDIAIDLGGYTHRSRTELFAMSVAPIQVNYLGYSGTMGSEFMDYIIADNIIIPEESKHYYSEKITYLPNSFMVNDTKIEVSKRSFTRQEAGLPSVGFVFCCFNNHYKITPKVFTSWMRILSQVDGSVLWLSKANKAIVENLKKETENNGIDQARLIFAPRLEFIEDHLSRV